MPTIRDVAKLAEVAPITVSRVINDSGYVSQETRARVEEAIEELGVCSEYVRPQPAVQTNHDPGDDRYGYCQPFLDHSNPWR